MYQISLQGSELVESYNIMKYDKTTLREIYSKDVEERVGTRKFLNTTIKNPCANWIIHNFFDIFLVNPM